MGGENKYISLQEVQLFLLDRFPEDNFLLDEREFEDDQIALAMQMVVDKYNSQTPIGVDWQKVETFPWRYEFTIGIASILLRMRAMNLMRNSIDWNNGGGIAVNERSYSKEYFAAATNLMQEFDARIAKIKQHINITEGYGSLGSEYARVIR